MEAASCPALVSDSKARICHFLPASRRSALIIGAMSDVIAGRPHNHGVMKMTFPVRQPRGRGTGSPTLVREAPPRDSSGKRQQQAPSGRHESASQRPGSMFARVGQQRPAGSRWRHSGRSDDEPSAGQKTRRPQTPRSGLQIRRDSLDRTSWRVLRNSQFKLYFFGSLASNLGSWLQNTAQVLLAYQLTHSVIWVGGVTCAQFAGSLFLGPWAAALADRVGGRRTLICTQLFSACVAASMAWLQVMGMLNGRLLIVGALGLGLAFTFALPVQVAMVPRLVPDRDTEAAMAMNSVSYNAGRAVAPVLCIVVISTIGFGWVFALNAISFLFFSVSLASLAKVRPLTDRKPSGRARAWDGLSIARSNPRIWLLLGMVAAVTIADDPVLVLGPALAHKVFGTSNDWAGYFLAALGCGTVLGSLVPRKLAGLVDLSRRSKRAALWLLALSGCIFIYIAGISPWVSLVAACGAGVAGLMTGAATQALLVQQAPVSAASVMALWAVAWAGTKPIASLLDGVLATVFSVRVAGIILILPALTLAIFELYLPRGVKDRLKKRTGQSWDQNPMIRMPSPDVPM
jgi:MFS family permease